MAAYRSRGRGTLILDIVVAGYEIRRATGFPDTPKGRAAHAAFKGVVRTWGQPATERLDLVADLSTGRRKVQELWRAYRTGQLHTLAGGASIAEDLTTAWTRWIATYPTPADATRKSAVRAILDGEEAQVRDLPGLVGALRDRFAAAGHPRAYNHYRDAARAFLRDTLTTQHPLYAQVVAQAPLPYAAADREPRTVADALAIRAKLPAPHGDYWWALCISGLRDKEYFSHQFTQFEGYLDVRGTKTRGQKAHSRRLVPLIEPIVVPARKYRAFQLAMKKYVGAGVTPYIARHTFADWLYRAGVPRPHRNVYRGHSRQTMEDLYERSEMIRNLAEDRARLAAFVHQGLAAERPRLSQVQ